MSLLPLFPDSHRGPPPDDRDSLDRFRRGERPILAALFRAHRPGIDQMLRQGFQLSASGGPARIRGVRDEVLRQDLVQETFIRAFADKARQSYDGLQPFERWLRSIARNLTVNHFKSHAVSRHGGSLDDEENALPEPSVRADAETQAEAQELLAIVREFTEGLDARERRVLEGLYRRHGLGISQKEIAKQVGVSHVTLRKLERSVLQRFEAHLRQKGYLEHTRDLAGGKLALEGALLLMLVAAEHLSRGGWS